MKKIYVLFTILLVGLFVGCASAPQESKESEYEQYIRNTFPGNMAEFILTYCHGEYEIVNIDNYHTIFHPRATGVSMTKSGVNGIFNQNGGTHNPGCIHVIPTHNWSCTKRIGIKWFTYGNTTFSIAYEY